MEVAVTVSKVKPALLGDRLVGQFADGLIAFLPLMVAGLIVGMVTGGDPTLPVLSLFVGFALFYLWFADGFAGGQSYGKRMVHTRVVDATTLEPCTFGQSFVRNFLLSVLGPIDWLFIFGPAHRRLGDYAAGTMVIDARS